MATDDRYDRTRRRFEELDVDERARFLIESSASMLAQGLERAGQVLADSLERVLRRADRASRSSEREERPGAAEPETAQRRTPRNGSSSTGS